METIKIFTLIGICIFSIYLLIILMLFRVPTSLSETYYLLQDRYKKGILFTIMMIILAICMAFPLFEFTPDNYKFLAFFMLLGILFTGAAPLFKDSSQSPIHYIGAGTSAIASIIWTIAIFPKDMSISYFIAMAINILGALLLFRLNKAKWLYIIELLLFINIFLIVTEFIQ